MPGGDLRIRTGLHPNPLGRWISFPVMVGGVHDVLMVLDPGSPVSAISPETRHDLARLNLLQPPTSPRYEHLLTGLVVQGQSFPDLDVRVLRRLSRIQVDGLVGLDFLSRFFAIHFYVQTSELILEYP